MRLLPPPQRLQLEKYTRGAARQGLGRPPGRGQRSHAPELAFAAPSAGELGFLGRRQRPGFRGPRSERRTGAWRKRGSLRGWPGAPAAQVPARETMGLLWERNAWTESGASAPVAMATRGTSGPGKSRAAPGRFCSRAASGSSPNFPLLRLHLHLLFL